MGSFVESTGGQGTNWADFLLGASGQYLDYRREVMYDKLRANDATNAPGTDGQRIGESIAKTGWLIPVALVAVVGLVLLARR